jgi:hypothetical protein
MAFITTEEVKSIRNTLKRRFPEFKFSVRREHHSKVNVAVLRGPTDFSDIFRDYSRAYVQINNYYPENYGEHADFITELVNIIKTAPAEVEGGYAWYDNSDIMTDYFDTAFYIGVEVGQWDKPYVQAA